MDAPHTSRAAESDNALAVARAVLERAPLFDGHNDLAWVIRVDKAARGDVAAYGLDRVHEGADTDIPRLRQGLVGAQFWAAFQPTKAPHPAVTALEQIDLIRQSRRRTRKSFIRRDGRPTTPRPRRSARSLRLSPSRAASASRIRSVPCAFGIRRACD